MRPLVLPLLLLALAACGTSAVTSDRATPAANASEAAGVRYAIQWHGYMAQEFGVPVQPHLAFIDVTRGGHRHDPVFESVVLLGDGDPIPARVALIGVGFQDATYRAVNVDLEIEGLAQGRHSFDSVRYRDEHGIQREVSIGRYVIEIVAPQQPDLSIWNAEVGSSRFARLGVELRNDLDGPVTVTGLKFNLPDLPVTTTMAVATNVPSPSGNAPAPAPSTVPTTRVDVGVGERFVLEFQFSGADPSTFVMLQPLVQYEREDGSDGLLPLMPHRYTPGFESPEQVEDFVAEIPESGQHELN